MNNDSSSLSRIVGLPVAIGIGAAIPAIAVLSVTDSWWKYAGTYVGAFLPSFIMVGIKSNNDEKSINKLQPDNISTYESNFQYSVADTLDDVEALTGKENVKLELKKKFPYDIKDFELSIEKRKGVMKPNNVSANTDFHVKGKIPIKLDDHTLISYLNTDGTLNYTLEAGQKKPDITLSVGTKPKIIVELEGESLISDIPKLKKVGKLEAFSVQSGRQINYIEDIINANIHLSASIPQTDIEKEAVVNDMDKLTDVFEMYYVSQ